MGGDLARRSARHGHHHPGRRQGRPADQPRIFGQFAEHLGRGIYEGVWVGQELPIPNTRGIRNDVVAALQAS